jgi:phosphotriesterase-related protein
MDTPDRNGKVQTVDGLVDPESLGITLPHEHTFIDPRSSWFEPPDSAYERKLAQEPVALDNLWFVRRRPNTNTDNMVLDDVDEAIEEYGYYHRAGGDTVVDVTPKNLGGDPERVAKISRATGLTFVHGTGYYTEATHPNGIADRSIDSLRDELVSDVKHGIDETGITAGVIGEIGISTDEEGEYHSSELDVLRAAARAARDTGAPLSVHPAGRTEASWRDYTYPSSRHALDLLDIIEEEGLAPERVIICHMDRIMWEDLSYQKALADRGAHLEYDLWGMEHYLEDDGPLNGWPSDMWRVNAVAELIEEGYSDRLLFSHDICMKIMRRRYGGFGYAHILENALPMLRENGVEQAVIDSILTQNPQRVLTFAEAG